MRHKRMAVFLVAILMVAFAGATLGQVRSELGKREYVSNCAVCHGLTGKGDGSYFELLKTRVPDITTMTERNKGVFPTERMFQIIDGREMPKSHGTRDMPIWGQEYLQKAAGYYGESPYDPEVYVRVRILSLIDYIYALQTRR